MIAEYACCGGFQRFYSHRSRETGGAMKFSVFLPPQAQNGPVPVLYYLAGLTCTEETFAIKAHAQGLAAKLGLMLVAPDTSPREPRIAGDADTWDFGQGAGFYVDASQAPWSTHYRMDAYVTRELPELVAGLLPALAGASGIFGHSMGGHGALTLGLRNPTVFKSISAFAPICAPMQCPWGRQAFSRYLGTDEEAWRDHDASELVGRRAFAGSILIDQGTADPFLAAGQLLPDRFAAAAGKAHQPLVLRMQQGYDHGYYFIQTFIGDHLRHHAQALKEA